MSSKATVFFIAAACVALGVAQRPKTHASIGLYRSWTLVTPKRVPMSEAVAKLCVAIVSSTSVSPHLTSEYLVYVNAVGKRAMLTGKEPFPVGSIIVKEKYVAGSGNSKPVLLTVMEKGVAGSMPSSGDWRFYTTSVGLERRKESVTHCVKCHAGQKDWVFRSYDGSGKIPSAKGKN